MEKTIGARIRERRKTMKISGAQIKEKTGISTGNLSDIENGKSLPSAMAIMQLAKILECSTDFILLGESQNLKTSNQSDIRENQLLNYFKEMSANDQEDILLIAEMKANKGKREKDAQSFLSRSGNEASGTA